MAQETHHLQPKLASRVRAISFAHGYEVMYVYIKNNAFYLYVQLLLETLHALTYEQNLVFCTLLEI
jgi:hypothetical protein